MSRSNYKNVFYIRKGKLVPVGKQVSNTSELDLMDVELLGTGTEYEQYADDGYTPTFFYQTFCPFGIG